MLLGCNCHTRVTATAKKHATDTSGRCMGGARGRSWLEHIGPIRSRASTGGVQSCTARWVKPASTSASAQPKSAQPRASREQAERKSRAGRELRELASAGRDLVERALTARPTQHHRAMVAGLQPMSALLRVAGLAHGEAMCGVWRGGLTVAGAGGPRLASTARQGGRTDRPWATKYTYRLWPSRQPLP
jgi:hypothetical protein